MTRSLDCFTEWRVCVLAICTLTSGVYDQRCKTIRMSLTYRACAWPTPYIAVGYASLIKAACDTQRLNNFRHCTVASVAAWNIYECYYMVLYSHVVDVRYDVGHIRSIPRFALVFAKGAFSMRYIG